MVAVMQPLGARFARDSPELFPARDRRHVAAHAPLIAAGVHVAFSSDLPVSPDPNPWPGIRTAIEDSVNGVSLVQALRAYTIEGAFASFDEKVKGTLEVGMLADLQVYSGDPLEMERDGWEALRPRAVLLGGAPVFGSL
jgi:predicted amidohydrolase YtcJ